VAEGTVREMCMVMKERGGGGGGYAVEVVLNEMHISDEGFAEALKESL